MIKRFHVSCYEACEHWSSIANFRLCATTLFPIRAGQLRRCAFAFGCAQSLHYSSWQYMHVGSRRDHVKALIGVSLRLLSAVFPMSVVLRRNAL